MTRENKLSIVIAFGMLVFVGMLVADHFSVASSREVAELGSNISMPPMTGTTKIENGPPTLNSTPKKNDSGDTIHTVQKGETLRTICSAYYGDSGLAIAVSRWNQLLNPNAIEQGQQICLPQRHALVFARPTSTTPTNNTTTPSTKIGKYTVKSGDTLSEISQKVMGTSKKTQLLIDLNKDVMPNPDRIRPGMVLQYPIPIP
jgi:LysM repeat protein|tara:strand:- start:162 stop:767 length:606 start_codon:yes stop_codon:yes gene_type:complete